MKDLFRALSYDPKGGKCACTLVEGLLMSEASTQNTGSVGKPFLLERRI